MIAEANVLEMQAVARSFPTATGRVDVLRSVDVVVRRGDFMGITGPSGSGKSTLLNLAALLDQPSAGRVLLEGEDVSALDAARLCEVRKRRIGMVFQKFNLLPRRSVLENVLFRFRYTEHDPVEARRLAENALRAMGIAEISDRPVRLLSGGEMQRVGIARAMALRPVLLVADEPTGNLDRVAAESVMECFRRMNAEDISVLLVTHNESLLRYCSRHMVCRDGSLVEAAV
jgi:ABC-type lipoprotein export system ATPase subunit